MEKKQIHRFKTKKALLLCSLLAALNLTGCDANNLNNNEKESYVTNVDNFGLNSKLLYGTEDDIEDNESLIKYGVITNRTLSDEYKEELITFLNNIIERELPSRQVTFKLKARINTSDYTNMTFEEIIQSIFNIETIEETIEFIEYYNTPVVQLDNVEIKKILI